MYSSRCKEPLPADGAEGRTREFLTYPVGQIFGDLSASTSVREIVYGMMQELLD